MTANKMNNLVKTLQVVMLSVILNGCTTVKQVAGDYVPFYTYAGNYLESIRVQADVDANRDLPVAIDFVFINDPAVTELLTKMSGPDWFAQKQGILLQHKDTVQVMQVEIVPFTADMALDLPEDFNAWQSILMFANYLGKEGQYVADITPYRQLRITLKRESYQLEEQDI